MDLSPSAVSIRRRISSEGLTSTKSCGIWASVGGGFRTTGGFGGGRAGGRRRTYSQQGGSFGDMFGSQYDEPMPQRGEDLQYKLSIALEDVLAGAEKKITFKVDGRNEEVKVRIPAGIASGQKLRLAGKGLPGAYGGPNGDIYLEIQILPHDLFTRDGDDLTIDKTISFSAAALGTTIEVPTLDGSTKKIKIPAGTQDHTKIRMKGFGMPVFKGASKGDQYVRISIQVPKKLTSKQEDLIKKLSSEGL